MDTYPPGFEESDYLRSSFIRDLISHLLKHPTLYEIGGKHFQKAVPQTLVRYWHDPSDLPNDVRDCFASWDHLVDEGVEIRTFCDSSAAAYIAERYGTREREAFARCRHPAMRSDYLRMCFVLEEGGLYVDADDVLLGDGWKKLLGDGRLKVQPLCYDVSAAGMVPSADIWQSDLPGDGRIFYINNDPIVAPPSHPVLRTALFRATNRLLCDDPHPEIQATTGPGNFTTAFAGHARDLIAAGAPLDFEILRDWDAVAETRWHLSYRNDARNWRNMDGG